MGGQAELSSLPIRNDSNVNMAGDKEFDIRVVTAKFSEAKSADGCVHLRPYIDGYRELLKFITLFGSVFSFVTSDVTDKLAILEKFLSAEPEQYETGLGRDEGLGQVTYDSYYSSLSKYHAWLVQKAVTVGTYALPTKQRLLERMGDPSDEECAQHLGGTVQAIRPVYDAVQELYHQREILDL